VTDIISENKLALPPLNSLSSFYKLKDDLPQELKKKRLTQS
jgi:hypothetical protein